MQYFYRHSADLSQAFTNQQPYQLMEGIKYMNNEQKRTIQDLRALGLTYRQIADITNLSANTVKSFCRRSDISRKFCRNCGKPLVSKAKRKPKAFCNDHCRQAWWQKNRNQMNKKAIYNFYCTNCNRFFESYGNQKRKFCSRGCYIAHRYGIP